VPSSHFYQLNEIVELIAFTRPTSILDVGVGFGKYGFLCREYLDVLDGSEELYHWKRQIDGIEIFEKYITPLQKTIYNRIYPGDALNILPTLHKKYDLILLIDIIEHFDFEGGERLIEMCRERGRNMIISTPRIDLPQTEMFGNPYEAHKAFYRKAYFKKFSRRIFIPNIFSLLVYMGDDAAAVRKALWRRRLLLNLPAHLKLLPLTKRFIIRSMKNAMAGKEGFIGKNKRGMS